MAEQNNLLSRVAQDFTWLHDSVAWPREDIGISKERWQTHRNLFRAVGADDGFVRRKGPPEIVLFLSSSKGLVTGGSMKGIAFSRDDLQPQFPSLDKMPPVKSIAT